MNEASIEEARGREGIRLLRCQHVGVPKISPFLHEGRILPYARQDDAFLEMGVLEARHYRSPSH